MRPDAWIRLGICSLSPFPGAHGLWGEKARTPLRFQVVDYQSPSQLVVCSFSVLLASKISAFSFAVPVRAATLFAVVSR